MQPAAAPSSAPAPPPPPDFVDRRKRWLYQLGWLICYFFYRLFWRYRVIGRENIPAAGALLVTANHASFLDPPAVGLLFFRHPLRFFAKAELFDVPVLGWLIAGFGSVPVQRGGADRKALETIRQLILRNEPVLLFPEGTRTRDGQLQEPKTGVAMIAMRHPETQILPVFVEGTFEIWPRHKRWPGPGRLTVYVGKPYFLHSLEAWRKSKSPGSQTADSGGAAPANEGAGEGGKKRLYCALAEEIMKKIMLAKHESQTVKPTSSAR